jgi:hypothetical protein
MRAKSRIQRSGGVADGIRMLARLCLDRQQQPKAKREIAALPPPKRQIVCTTINEDNRIYSSQRMFWEKME